jgi:hypothetical protein
MSKYFPSSTEVRRLAKQKKELDRATDANELLDNSLRGSTGKVLKTTPGFNDALTRYNRDKYLSLLDKFKDINLRTFAEADYPEQYDEVVDMLEKVIKSVRSDYQTLIEASNIDYYDIAKAIYDKSIVPEKEKLFTNGESVDIEKLMQSIEDVTEYVGQKGIENLKKKRPFFFQ